MHVEVTLEATWVMSTLPPPEKRKGEIRSPAIPAVIVLVAILEWALFELLRVPYQPPHDMRTLLGTEKYMVRDLMIGVAVLGNVYVLYLVLTSSFSIRGYFYLTSFVALLLTIGVVVVRHPLWPVTPWELLWQ